jgi:hypothetical protein
MKLTYALETWVRREGYGMYTYYLPPIIIIEESERPPYFVSDERWNDGLKVGEMWIKKNIPNDVYINHCKELLSK